MDGRYWDNGLYRADTDRLITRTGAQWIFLWLPLVLVMATGSDADGQVASESPSASTKVLVVAGSPRGGTTITNMLLGQHPGIFATGGMNNFPHGGHLFAKTNICSCGQQARRCPFWSEVLLRYRHWWKLIDCERIPHVFHTMAALSGREYITDVSHNSRYIERLLTFPGIEVYLLHVVRDGRGVLYSRIRRDYRRGHLQCYSWRHFRRAFKVSRHWSRHIREFAVLEKRLGKRALRVGYEQLCHDPATALRPVGELLGLDFEAIGDEIGHAGNLHVLPHLIRGNPRLRLKQDIKLREDIAFRTALSLLDRMTFQLASRLP